MEKSELEVGDFVDDRVLGVGGVVSDVSHQRYPFDSFADRETGDGLKVGYLSCLVEEDCFDFALRLEELLVFEDEERGGGQDDAAVVVQEVVRSFFRVSQQLEELGFGELVENSFDPVVQRSVCLQPSLLVRGCSRGCELVRASHLEVLF